jgi:hypothetical protein
MALALALECAHTRRVGLLSTTVLV